MAASRDEAVSFPWSPLSASRARTVLTARLDEAGLTKPLIADAALVLTELVANAIRHGAPLPDGTLRVAWRIEPARLRIEVTDGGSVKAPRMASPNQESTDGRGLRMVNMLSEAWGVRRAQGASTVWTVLSR